MPRETIKSCQAQQIKAWNAIKELLITKSVSLHRILNQTTTLKTTTWKSKYELQERHYRDCKNFIKSNKNSSKATEKINKQPKQPEPAETFHSNNTRYCTGMRKRD